MKVLAVLTICVLGVASAAPGWHHKQWRYQQWKPVRSHHMHMAKAAPTEAPAPRVAELPSIAAAAIATPSLSTLVTAVKAAGLVETLSGEGTFTVFAPNNDAFAKVPAEALGGLLEDKEALTAVLLRHVLPVSVKAGDIPAGSTVLKTVGGEEITVTNADGAVTIESNGVIATVIATDVLASNGVVHVIDTVLAAAPAAEPATKEVELPSIAAAAIATPSLSTLVTAVKAAGLVETLSGEGTFTVFAPNNDAFAKVPAEALGGLLEDKEALTAVLLRHVLPVSVKAGDIPAGSTILKTVGGEEITVTNADGAVTIESNGVIATVIATDVLASNGVVHVIDTVLAAAPAAEPATKEVELPSIAAAAIATPRLSTLVTAVKAAGLVETLSGEGTFTVFAPTNDAFAKVPAEALGGLLEDKEALTAVLLRHVLPVPVKAGDIPAGSTVLKTVGGEDITVTNADGAVTIESSAGKATVIATDVLASNGVVHLVDTVF